MVLPETQEVYTLYLQKRFKSFIICILLSGTSFSQKPIRHFYSDSFSIFQIQENHFYNKSIPPSHKKAIIIALSYYPELSLTKIKFRVKKASSPLSARPSLITALRKASKRNYVITISHSTYKKLTPILINNLSFNSQIGVVGHELAHISFYESKRGIYFVKLFFMHLNRRAVDKFEFNTDKICIEHGLGFQLYSWSKEVREKLTLNKWGGSSNPKASKERYMNPNTIINYMNNLNIYSEN
jgi:hypothetical protein